MTADEVCSASLSDLVTELDGSTLGAVELLDHYLDRIAERNDTVNALIQIDDAAARRSARASEQRRAAQQPLGELDGIPIVVKDNIDVAGLPTTNGLGMSRVARVDADVVKHMRAVGIIVLGKANMDEGALSALSDNPHHGRIQHPQLPGLTPGGSSGGSAAALASGFCAAAIGTDTLGSVRLPAAYCGLVGFKPTHGAASNHGIVTLGHSLDCPGPITRSVADSRLLMDCLVHGIQTTAISARPRWCTLENIHWPSLTPDVMAAYTSVLDQLQQWQPAEAPLTLPDWEPAVARRSALLLIENEAAIRWASDRRTEPQAFSSTLHAMLDYGYNASEARLNEARARISAAGKALRHALAKVDLIALPTTPQSAPRFDAAIPTSQADFTALANFAGCPSISIPCSVAQGASPIGLQLISRRGSDAWLLAVGELIEAGLRE